MVELNKKIAEWLGIKWRGATRTFPVFTDSLDACFKYIVPKLLEEYNIESYSFKQCDGWHYSEVSIWEKGSTKHNFETLHDKLIAKHFETGRDLTAITALALCRAVEKLIDA